MQCPKCNGDVWDNRPKKLAGGMKPNAPDFACRDKDGCGWKQWPPKGTKPAAASIDAQGPIASPGAPQAQSGPSGRYTELGDLYWRCFNEVLTTLKQEKLVDLFHGDAIAAMVATLFIQRAKG